MSSTNPKRHPFIVLEGCDRVGKTTTCQALCSRLNRYTRNHVTSFKFPFTETSLGTFIYKYINNYFDLELSDVVIHHLFSANRWERRLALINQLRTEPVVCDRYVASGRAYTAAQGNLTLEWCKQFDEGLPRPDLTIYLECNMDKLSRRRGFGLSYLETIDFQQKVKKQFEILRDEEPNWVSIDTSYLKPDEVIEKLNPVIHNLMQKFKDDSPPLEFYSIPDPPKPNQFVVGPGPHH